LTAVSHLYTRFDVAGKAVGVLLVDQRPDENAFDVSERLYHEHPQHLVHSDVVVIRRAVGSEKPLELAPIRKRAPKAAVYFLSIRRYEVRCKPATRSDSIGMWATEADLAEFVSVLRQRELEEFVQKSTALFRSSEPVVYRSPSGKLCRAFLRAGSVQRGRHEIDALSFWLLPYADGVDAIVADTWSISSTVLNTLRLAAAHDRKRRAIPIDFEILAAYQDGTATAEADAARVLLRATQRGSRKMLAVISTVMTGASVSRLRRQLTELGVPLTTVRFVALYALGSDRSLPVLCDLSERPEIGDFGVVDEVVRDRVIIDIDRHTYFPLHIDEKTVEVRFGPVRAEVEEIRRFATEYQGTGAVALHRDATELTGGRLRHHAFYIDVERLLNSEKFVARLREKLGELSASPKAIVVPPHSAGLRLAAAVQGVLESRFGSRAPLVVSRYLDGDDPWMRDGGAASLGADDEIVLVDDVSVTGFRLAKFQKHLRGVFKGRINYIIGVARPESRRAWSKRTRDLAFRAGHPNDQHRVLSVETILLPDWNERECPWCEEERALTRVVAAGATGELLQQLQHRIRHLVTARLSQGLIDDAVWRVPASALSPRLTENSVFLTRLDDVEATDADVFGAVAAVLQLYRKIPDGLQSGYPLLSTIAHSDYLGTTFTDAVLRLAFLRGARSRELTHWKTPLEATRAESLRLLLTDKGIIEPWERDSVMREVSVAILLGRLPSPSLSADEWKATAVGIPGELLQLVAGLVNSH
jgi:hypothetical protein